MSKQYIKDIDVNELLGHQKANIAHDLPRRKWLYSWLLDPNIPGNFQTDVDKWIGILIVLNLFSLVFEHVPAVYEPNQGLFHAFDVFSVAVFTIEYLTRWYLAPEDEEFKGKSSPRVAFMLSPFAIIDFLAVAPFYFQAFIPIDLRMLRFLRLLRILKLFRIIIPAIHEFRELNQGRTFRQKMHALVFPSDFGGKLHQIFDVFIAIWVLLSVASVVLESIQSLDYILHLQFIILDAIAVGVFTVELFLRIYSCVEDPQYQDRVAPRLGYVKSGSAIIDILAVIPFFLEVFLHHLFDLRFLRVFRLARLLKLTRYNDATEILIKVVVREWPVMSASAFIMMLLVVMTASLGYLFEHDAQPDKFENIPQSIYWAVITLASVGYGDISPVTPVGRFMTIILALLGIGIFAIPAALLSSAFSDQLVKERDTLKANLFSMLKDGELDENEIILLRNEAKRLHLTVEELNQLIDQIIKEHDVNTREIPLVKVAEQPELAVEHYKQLLGEIRRLGLLTDHHRFDEAAQQGYRLAPQDLTIWKQIQGKS